MKNTFLEKPYSQEEFLQYLSEFLPDFKKDIRSASQLKSLTITDKVNFLGLSDELNLEVFEITHRKSLDARVSLATDGFRIMKQRGVYTALAVYKSLNSDNWRLSLMTTSLSVKKGKVKEKFSNPRRYSFYLGPDAKVNTPFQFLLNKGKIKDFDDLKSRFSIEVVNKEFYKQISQKFTQLVGGTLGKGRNKKTYKSILRLPSTKDHSQTSLEFAVRLIGRIIFCWFLREKKSQNGKSLMPNQLLSLEALDKYQDYYHKVLEPIFFEVLNKPEKQRSSEYDNKNFSLIPYLNGGLFTPHDDDFYKKLNGDLQSRHHNTLVIPDDWFRQFFDILETYNFTIDENTTFDEELSIDPEMLGRIFENLLAEINPETGESARKSTGSYYTPRVIVDYMVDESLLLYLKRKTKIKEDRLRAIISYDLTDDENYPLNKEDKQKITNALENLKLLDPACGSGAFPIGALQKMVFILQQIDPDGQLWFKKQIQFTPPELRRVIQREFKHQNFDYIRKLGIIRKNIYGVDIQPIATEISRLRCFLTLVVDQYVSDKEENRGIEPLPNLDFKFVTANTLIGLPESSGNTQAGLFEDREGIEELKEIRDMFFNASGGERDQLKLQFVQSQNKMFQNLISGGLRGHADLTTKLTTWNPFSHKTSDWFDPEWMFGIKDGFDIVIANPPYFVYQGEKIKDLKIIKKLNIYKMVQGGKLNAYRLFLARSTQLQKKRGILCEIFQNSFLGDNSAKLLREHFFNTQQIIHINSFPERDNTKKRVFEAVKMSVCILLSKRIEKRDYSFNLNVWESKNMDVGFSTKYLKSEILKVYPTSFQIPMLDQNTKKLFIKVCNNYSKTSISCKEGELNMTFHKKYFSDDSSKPKIIKGAAIQRYVITDNLSQGSVEYLNVKSYLKDYKSSKKSHHHQSQRIVMQGITGVDDKHRLIMTILPKGQFCANSCNYIIFKKGNYNIYFLLGLYNSYLLNWVFKKTSTNSNVNCYEIENLPIPTLNSSNCQLVLKITNCVTKILETTKKEIVLKNSNQSKINKLNSQVDQLVYKLYGLTTEEVEIIKGNIKHD